MKLKYSLGIMLMLSSLPTLESWGQWIQISTGSVPIYGHQVVSMSVSNNGNIFAGTVRGGIYISKNTGSSWIPSNQGLTDGAVNSFSLNGSSMFVAMNSGGGVLRSSNDGVTWSKVNNGLPSFAIVDLESVNGRVFALANTGTVYFSDTNGDSWLQLTSTPLSVTSLAYSGTTIFIGTSGGVYRSSDSGAVWTLINSLPDANIYRMDADGGTIVVSTVVGKYISVDSGSSWNLTILPFIYPYIARIGSTILASDFQGGMQRSVNNGATWTMISNVPASGDLLSIGSNFFASTVHGVYLSVDDGLTWSPTNIGLAKAHPVLSADGPAIIYTDGINIKISQDWGATWTTQTIGPSLNISVLAKGNKLYVSKMSDALSSLDNGVTWTSIPSLGGEKIFGYGEGNNLYAADPYTLFRSTGDGTWTEQSSNVRWVSSFAAKGNKVFTGSIFGGNAFTGVFSSVDQGVTWQQVNNSLPQINSMSYDGTLLVSGTSSGVYKSINDGVTWTSAGLENTNVNSIILDGSKIYAANRGIEISNDNGISWTSITGEIAPTMGSFHEITTLTKSGTRILAATSKGDVWISKCVDPETPVVTGVWNHHPTTLASSSAINNQWYLDGNKIIGATGQNLEVNASGSYSLKVIIDGCPSGMSSDYVITDCIIPPIPIISLSGVSPNFTLTSSAPEGNQWFLNGTLIPDATGQNYSPSFTGTYSVQVTIDGCKSAMSSSFPLVITGDIHDQSKEVKIYPNPVSNELYISDESSRNIGQLTVRISDLFGRVIQHEIMADTYPIRINTSILTSGIYIVELNRLGIVMRCRFVKN